MRPWLRRLKDRSRHSLNALADETGLLTESGRPVRFVAPGKSDPYYEIHVFETGCVHTRDDNWHDLLNALVWLAFPRTKARINAMHAAAIPFEGGKRGPLRDLLTIFDEGGAIRTPTRTTIFGHATMEQALKPWPGITCKVLCLPGDDDLDGPAAALMGALAPHGTPKHLATRPVFRELGWGGAYNDVQGAGQAAAVPSGMEESPGSTEQDAG